MSSDKSNNKKCGVNNKKASLAVTLLSGFLGSGPRGFSFDPPPQTLNSRRAHKTRQEEHNNRRRTCVANASTR